jgi:anthranilate 1,2-dioxygenase ferredoxin reductase component
MSADPYLIIGGGQAARRAAETLRARDAHAPIVLVGAEPDAPYDRPCLSKEALLSDDGATRAFVRDAAWYARERIALRLGVAAVALDRRAQRVRLADGTDLPYAGLVLATGSRVRRFAGPVDADLPLHYVRTLADAHALRAALQPGRRVAVLGGGFIGLEVASAAIRRGCAVTLIEPGERLLRRGMPDVVAAFVRALHVSAGVDLRLATLPERIVRGPHGCARIETDRGAVDAEVVVVGIGVTPNLELAAQAGLETADGIRVDAGGRTADPAIVAAGEVTSHFNPLLGRHLRVESWQVAEHQPAVAAANLLGGDEIYAEWPWLWSDQYDCNLQTLGVFEAGQTLVLRGDPEQGRFCVFGLRADGALAAAAAVNAGREISAARRLFAAGHALDPRRLADPAQPLRVPG